VACGGNRGIVPRPGRFGDGRQISLVSMSHRDSFRRSGRRLRRTRPAWLCRRGRRPTYARANHGKPEIKASISTTPAASSRLDDHEVCCRHEVHDVVPLPEEQVFSATPSLAPVVVASRSARPTTASFVDAFLLLGRLASAGGYDRPLGRNPEPIWTSRDVSSSRRVLADGSARSRSVLRRVWSGATHGGSNAFAPPQFHSVFGTRPLRLGNQQDLVCEVDPKTAASNPA